MKTATKSDSDAPGFDFFSLSQSAGKIRTKARGPRGVIKFTRKQLRDTASGPIFGASQDAGMGLPVDHVWRPKVLIMSTCGGLRAKRRGAPPTALGLHIGHGNLEDMEELVALKLTANKLVPHAVRVSDVCDGRTQGTPGMSHSLAYRNNGAMVFHNLSHSLPGCQGVIAIATCDKGLPAITMAGVTLGDMPFIVIPGGVTLPPLYGGTDTASIQTVGTAVTLGHKTLAEAGADACRVCATPGGGCQFFGTAATAQVVDEAFGLTVPHAALAPSGSEVWFDAGDRSVAAMQEMIRRKIGVRHVMSDGSIKNALAVHAATGGSSNLVIHISAIAQWAGVTPPTVRDWRAINAKVPRLLDVLPNGPKNHATVYAYLAGGVPEVMIHLRELGLLDLHAMTVIGKPMGWVIEEWEKSERRRRVRDYLFTHDKINPDDVIMPPKLARERGMTGTTVFPTGNVAREGSLVKATAIDPKLCKNGVFHGDFKARVFVTEAAAIQAIRARKIQKGEVIVLICIGPKGAGCPETYMITSVLKQFAELSGIPLVTDGRFSGVSTGACIGLGSPEALAGGAIGKILDGDIIRITVDKVRESGSVNMVGSAKTRLTDLSVRNGSAILAKRGMRRDLAPQAGLTPQLITQFSHVSSLWTGCVPI